MKFEEASREKADLTSLTAQLYQLERKRNELEARYATDEFEEMVRMDVEFDEKAEKRQNMDLLRQAQEVTKAKKCKLFKFVFKIQIILLTCSSLFPPFF